MELAFVRNQIELKLNETDMLLSTYLEGIEKEFALLKDAVDETRKVEIESLFSELKTFSTNIKEIELDFGISIVRLKLLHAELAKNHNLKVAAKIKSRTTTFEDITIVRTALQYSQLADSIGYDNENRLMDIGYASGSVYRYYNVPVEYFESLKDRNNLKGFKTEIAVYEVKKIE